ncbi:hypothetical protein [Bacillus sp. Brlt_9]|uniref:hypothetical protein n=1 Tax=Bacillus sp. Brlt_9 TaxID=3110916 RepID=UPI003F7B5984
MKVALVKKGEVIQGNAQSITQQVKELLSKKLGFEIGLESNASEIENERVLDSEEFKLRLCLEEIQLEKDQHKKLEEVGFTFEFENDTQKIISVLGLLAIKCFVEPRTVQMIRNGEVIFENLSCDVREKIEEMIEEKIGITVQLQEDDTEDEFEVYVHTDTYEDLTEEEIDKIEEVGINEDPVGGTQAIKKYLDIEFKYID